MVPNYSSSVYPSFTTLDLRANQKEFNPMPKNRFLRGVLLVLCAQIPLLAFFLYLLFLGVGISEFANLADSRHVEFKRITALVDDRDLKLRNQLLDEMKATNLRLNGLKKALTTFEEANLAWKQTVTTGNPNDLRRLRTSLTDIEARLVSLSKQVAAREDQLRAIENQRTSADARLSSLSGTIETFDRRLGPLVEEVSRLDAQSVNLGNRLQSLQENHTTLETNVSARDKSISSDLKKLSENLEAVNLQGAAPSNVASQPPSLEALLKKHSALFAPHPKRKPAAELLFEADDWRLNLSANRELNKVITRIRKSDRPVQIGIYGFTTKNGPLNFTMALADKRARAVAELMREAGVTNDPITIFVVPEYRAYREVDNTLGSGQSAHRENPVVHIYIDQK